ncbi:nucleotide sugar dehydrogenase [Stackebrandtia endophytica]
MNITPTTTDLAVVGMGYVGLPLAREASRAGLKVVGFDVNPETVAALNSGRSHIDDISDADVQQMLASGFTATCDPQVHKHAATIVICVPTPLSNDGGPDLRAVVSASETIAAQLQPGALVILESTTYPGTTDEVVRPILESTGLAAGIDFSLAFSPERVDPGNQTFGIRNTPKVVGGLTARCSDAAAAFYGKFVDTVVRTKGTREAEMAKLLENTYRHVNIALVNEMAVFCHELGIDLWNVIGAAATKPFGFQAFYPGPGVGGHCIPIDPNYLSHRVKGALGYPFRFVELAEEINNRMPDYVVHRAVELLNTKGLALSRSRILLLGITYKADIADQRESPAEPIAAKLLVGGASLQYHDPHISDWTVRGQTVDKVTDWEAAAAQADVTILLTNHLQYQTEALLLAPSLLLDTRGTARALNDTDKNPNLHLL